MAVVACENLGLEYSHKLQLAIRITVIRCQTVKFPLRTPRDGDRREQRDPSVPSRCLDSNWELYQRQRRRGGTWTKLSALWFFSDPYDLN